MNKRLLGAHLSIAGGLYKALERAQSVDATCVQIFTKNNKAYFAKPLEQEQIDAFTQLKIETGITEVVTHAAYLINVCSATEATREKSKESLVLELTRCNQLGIKYLVLHPGSHTGQGVERGVELIAKNISECLLEAGGQVKLLLETAAGQGTNVGATFEELRAIYDQVDPRVKSRVGICFDTCHVHSAGYNLGSIEQVEEVFKQFDKILGPELLDVIHLNDSKTPCNSRRDRHENLGKGTIPLDVLLWFGKNKRFEHVPVILETPSEDGITEYIEEIALLRE